MREAISSILTGISGNVFTVFPHPPQNEIPYVFPTFSRLYGPHSLPILYEIVWNHFYLQRIYQNIGYERTWFSNNLVLSVVTYHTFCFKELSYIFHTFENMKFPKLFFYFLTHSQPFLTLSANSLPFQGLKKFKTDSWLFQDFAYLWETCF